MENTRSIEEIRAERVKVGKAQAAALRKAYRCDARLSELTAELGEGCRRRYGGGRTDCRGDHRGAGQGEPGEKQCDAKADPVPGQASRA